jgi:hypothetical protein
MKPWRAVPSSLIIEVALAVLAVLISVAEKRRSER